MYTRTSAIVTPSQKLATIEQIISIALRAFHAATWFCAEGLTTIVIALAFMISIGLRWQTLEFQLQSVLMTFCSFDLFLHCAHNLKYFKTVQAE